MLLNAKLKRPRSVSQVVLRPRLLELLQSSLTLPLTIVAAPPGYGKTTLVGLWLDEIDIPWAWYSLDYQDNSLDNFATYLAAALNTGYPGCGKRFQSLVQNPVPPQPEQLAELFVAELDALPGELVFVLDDYHEITQPTIHTFMASVVQNAPARVHFVLLTRADPPFNLTRLHAQQQLLTVRAAHLRFTEAEAGLLLQQVMGSLATAEVTSLFCSAQRDGPLDCALPPFLCARAKTPARLRTILPSAAAV